MTQTDAFIADLFADQSDDPILVCMTIDHADLAQPFRVVNDTVDLVSNSVTYTAYPFEFTPPEQRHGALYPAQITIDNVHRDIIMAIRDLLTAPTATAFIVRASDPDTVEMQFPEW
ncbi:MAG: DUF1833 family protein, partial [Salinibacterium sp.]|nr:DUF1833 family protein [Salinibacterium sp.]